MKKNNYHHKRARGFTLVELIIAIALFTIIVSVATGAFTNALHTQRQVSSLISTQSNVSLALEQMTREIRTGYLFCHDIDSVSPNPTCGCTISDSFYNPGDTADPSAPADPSAEIPSTGDYPLWTCHALDYYTASGVHVTYSRSSSGSLLRDINDGSGGQSITGSNVNVQSLEFTLFGNLEGDNWTPRVTIAIGVTPSSTDPATMNDVLNLQTTVSGRTIDCTNASGSLQC